MTSLHALHVETQGGVADLGRVVGVLALYDLTPLGMTVGSVGPGLRALRQAAFGHRSGADRGADVPSAARRGSPMTLRNAEPLQLHIPQPRLRPGDAPDFSRLELPGPGEARRPDVDAGAAEFRD